LLLVLGCANPVAPFVPPADAVPFTPPDSLYAAWWQLDEACSGLSGDWHRITWFTVPDTAIATPKGDFWGVWLAPHSIYLVATHTADSALVRHEMLHDLLQRGDHPAVFDVCGVR
jgi:hypothetical protein